MAPYAQTQMGQDYETSIIDYRFGFWLRRFSL